MKSPRGPHGGSPVDALVEQLVPDSGRLQTAWFAMVIRFMWRTGGSIKPHPRIHGIVLMNIWNEDYKVSNCHLQLVVASVDAGMCCAGQWGFHLVMGPWSFVWSQGTRGRFVAH